MQPFAREKRLRYVLMCCIWTGILFCVLPAAGQDYKTQTRDGKLVGKIRSLNEPYDVCYDDIDLGIEGVDWYASVRDTSVADIINGKLHFKREGQTWLDFAFYKGYIGQGFIVASPPIPRIRIHSESKLTCEGIDPVFIGSPKDTSVKHTASRTTYQWQLNGVDITGANDTIYTSNALKTGDLLKCTVTNADKCFSHSASDSIIVNRLPTLMPTVNVTHSQLPACPGTPVTFTATAINAGAKPLFTWQVNGRQTGPRSNTFTSADLHNKDVVTCTVLSETECVLPITSNPVVANLYTAPAVKFNSDVTITFGDELQLRPAITGSIVSYSWSPATALSNASIADPVVKPYATTNYTLSVITVDGCTASASVSVKAVPPPVVVNNTFTPNGDGINDTWPIPALAFYPDCLVHVYTRSGELVLRSRGYPKPWDGTFNGRNLPVGTYYYIITSDKYKMKESGSVTIIR